MADKKISALSAATAIVGTEEVPVVQSGSTVKATAANLGPATIAALQSKISEVARNDQAQTFTGLQTFGSISLGGHSITDTLISTDGASTSDTVYVTPGWIDANVSGGGGGVTALSVANIDDPSTELNAIAGSAKGDLRLCYQTVAGADEWTLYAWDDADSGSEDVPYHVDGLTGMWAAMSGRYTSQSMSANVALRADYGTAALPGYAFEGTLNAGVYFGGSSVGLSYNGGTTKVELLFGNVKINTALEVDGALNHDGTTVGFYGTTPVAKQTGVAVSAAGIHAALVNLGLIT